jgi:hypothetical protein
MKISDLLHVKAASKISSNFNDAGIIIIKKLNQLLLEVKRLELDSELSTRVTGLCNHQIIKTTALLRQAADDFVNLFELIDHNISQIESTLMLQVVPEVSGYDEAINRRPLHCADYGKELLLSRIGKYSSWQYPAMELNPRHPNIFTTTMVASDPLYLVDIQFEQALTNALSIFTPEYQARLRPYFINGYDFSVLPKEQFGFVFSANSFEYINLKDIEKCIASIYPLLLPGGTFVFTYNNCEIPNSARLAENNLRSYTTQSQLLTFASKLGFEVSDVFNFSDGQPLSWIELKKPGTLKTIKGHQTLGAIKDIE